MAKKQKQPTKSCSDCIHEFACRMWTDGRYISDETASRCPNHETVKESSAYLCGVLDERKRKQTNADRIRAMSDEELVLFLEEFSFTGCPAPGKDCGESCRDCIMEWLKQPAEE